MKSINNIEELFGTLQQSVVAEWRKHLKTSKYSKHMALDEFYKEMPELIDALIEDYNGHTGKKVENFKNVLDAEKLDALQYLEELHKICQDGYDFLPDDAPEIKSDLDAIKSKIDGVMYKIRELKEHHMKSLSEYLLESVLNEAKQYTIYMPCNDPEQMENIHWAIKNEFGETAEMDTSSWTFGDEHIKCYVAAKSTSQIKKFCKEHDADFE